MLKKAAKIESGAADPLRQKVGKVTWDQCKDIASQKMEDLNAKGLFVDDLQKLRVMDPEMAEQTKSLKEECGGFVEQMTDFQKMADSFILLTDEVKQMQCKHFKVKVIMIQKTQIKKLISGVGM